MTNKTEGTPHNPAGTAPLVTTDAATMVTSSSATLNAGVNANGETTSSLSIRYGSDKAKVSAGRGTEASVTPTSATGKGNTPITANVTGLVPGTVYYCMASATNSSGSSSGDVKSFTTPFLLPVVTTEAASDLGGSFATLNGTVNANGELTTALTIKYSTDEATVNLGGGTEGVVTPASVSGSSSEPVSSHVTGLEPGQTYYYRVSATNTTGIANGKTESLTTPLIFSNPGAFAYTIPPGVTSTQVVAIGGGGGSARNAIHGGGEAETATFTLGGAGAVVTSTLAVTPGQVLKIFVGGAGECGGNFAGGGGGATTVDAGKPHQIVAGGGGGAGSGVWTENRPGGGGGGPGGNGEQGGQIKFGQPGGGGGGGGGLGGAGGKGGVSSNKPGSAGGAGNGGSGGGGIGPIGGGIGPNGGGNGGTGGGSLNNMSYGGGGGGGYGGGGGGGGGVSECAGGGGGGSVGPSGTVYKPGDNAGDNGSVTLSNS